MIISRALLMLVVSYLALIQALPVWLGGKKKAIVKPDPTFLNISYPSISPFAKPHEIREQWKETKNDVNEISTQTHRTLEEASNSASRPDLRDFHERDTRVDLVSHHAELKGWVEVFGSKEDKKWDPDGRRATSAHLRAQMLEELHGVAEAFHKPNQRWADVVRNTTPLLARTKDNYNAAAEKKKGQFRSKYGEHVRNTLFGLPVARFVSSRDAKARLKDKQIHEPSTST